MRRWKKTLITFDLRMIWGVMGGGGGGGGEGEGRGSGELPDIVTGDIMVIPSRAYNERFRIESGQCLGLNDL